MFDKAEAGDNDRGPGNKTHIFAVGDPVEKSLSSQKEDICAGECLKEKHLQSAIFQVSVVGASL